MDLPNDAPKSSGSEESQMSRPQTRTGLLPAFEPILSPRLPSSTKRKHDGSRAYPSNTLSHYPTPVPTSSTGILPSSSPQLRPTRPGLQRTASTVSERVPLGDVAGLELPFNGDALLLGRSSNSSQYQLSANRLISRIHVKAAYHPPDDHFEKGKVIIECLGWNGLRVQCQGFSSDLGKGDSFTSEKPNAEIMIGVQDARVLIRWPVLARKDFAAGPGGAGWDIEGSPSRPTPPATPLPSSPPLLHTHLRSPISPSPRVGNQLTASRTFLGLPGNPPSSPPAVQVYEDHESPDEVEPDAKSESVSGDAADPPGSASKQSIASSCLSPPEEFSDHDEENDPIIHSFGPFGENLLPRMASFRAVSPERPRNPLRVSISPKQPLRSNRSPGSTLGKINGKSIRNFDLSPVCNHVINQLAFSRLHSLPVSSILHNLPTSLKAGVDASSEPLSSGDLEALLHDAACIGEIAREGKDAAGKPLENEYYYVPEMDIDEARREAVEGSLGKPGLRAVRKQHKQYFWKRPRH